MLAAARSLLVLLLSLFLVVPLLAALSLQIQTVSVSQTQLISSSLPKVFHGQIHSISDAFLLYSIHYISIQFIL